MVTGPAAAVKRTPSSRLSHPCDTLVERTRTFPLQTTHVRSSRAVGGERLPGQSTPPHNGTRWGKRSSFQVQAMNGEQERRDDRLDPEG